VQLKLSLQILFPFYFIFLTIQFSMNTLRLLPVPQASQQDFISKAAYQYENTLFQHSQFKVNYLAKLRELLKGLEQKANAIRQSQLGVNTSNQIHQQPTPLSQHPQQPIFSGPPANPILVNNTNNNNVTINDGTKVAPNGASIMSNTNGPSSNMNFGVSPNSVNEELKRQIQRKVMSSPIPAQVIASIAGFPEGINQWSQINDFKAKNLLKPEHMTAIKMAFEKIFVYYLRIYEQQKKQMIQRQQQHQRQQINKSGQGEINNTNNNNQNNNNHNNVNPNQFMARDQLNRHTSQNINQLLPQMQQKLQNQSTNWQSIPMSTRPSVNHQPNTSMENSIQVSNTTNVQQVNQTGQTDRSSQVNKSSFTNQSNQLNHPTVDSVNKTLSSFTQQDLMKLRELKAEADKRPIPLRDITSTLSQSDKEQITTLLKPVAVSFPRVDQSIFLFFQHTRNEKNSIRFFQLKEMFKQLWDGINKGKFMVTVQLAEKIRAEFGQYFSFVNRLGLRAQANISQGGGAEASQNGPRDANSMLQTQQSQTIQTQNKSLISPEMQQQPVFSQNTVSLNIPQNQQQRQQNLTQNIQHQAQQVVQPHAQVHKTQSIQAQNTKQVQHAQEQVQSQAQLAQQLQQTRQAQLIPPVQQRGQSVQPQTHQPAQLDAPQETQEQGQRQAAFRAQKAQQAAKNGQKAQKAQENTQKAAQPLKVAKNTQSQKNKQSPKISKPQEKRSQQQPSQIQANTGLTSKPNANTPEIKNSTIPGVPTYGKPGISADQLKLPTKKRKASAAPTPSSVSSTASPEELRLNTNQSIKKGKIDESETTKIKEIALKLQRKKEESKRNPLGYFISSLGEALSIPPEKIEQAKRNDEVEKADELTTSSGETGWKASTVPALTLQNAFQSIDAVKTTPRSVPQTSIEKLDLNEVDKKDGSKLIGGKNMIQALLSDDFMNVNVWNYDELVSVLCVDEVAMKRDYWTLKC
jgi:hypothetical protein